jgi:hypothetical protein
VAFGIFVGLEKMLAADLRIESGRVTYKVQLLGQLLRCDSRYRLQLDRNISNVIAKTELSYKSFPPRPLDLLEDVDVRSRCQNLRSGFCYLEATKSSTTLPFPPMDIC